MSAAYARPAFEAVRFGIGELGADVDRVGQVLGQFCSTCSGRGWVVHPADMRDVYLLKRIVPVISLMHGGCADPLAAGVSAHSRAEQVTLDADHFERLQGNSASSDLPSAQAIAQIKGGIQLLEDMQSVGVGDTVSMNRASRVKVRSVTCQRLPNDRTLCSYETDRCREGESIVGTDGWCRRKTRFVCDDDAWQGEPQK